jgi:hypothetical protein
VRELRARRTGAVLPTIIAESERPYVPQNPFLRLAL